MDTDFNNYFDETHFTGVLTVPEKTNVVTGCIVLETTDSILEVEADAIVILV